MGFVVFIERGDNVINVLEEEVGVNRWLERERDKLNRSF